jgi:hypothetical protein
MRRVKNLLTLLFCLVSVCALLGACARSAQVRFYSLAPQAGQAEAPAPATPCLSLGLGPVEFPAYLDRTQIVTKGQANRMNLAEFDQWIEPVRDNFAAALMDALGARVCAKPLMSFPWPGSQTPDRQITVTVRQFDGNLGGEAVLRADWSVIDKDGKVLAWKSTTLREACPGVDYQALVSAQSKLVVRLAEDMAGALGGK